jgi:hypothetical protein
VCPLKKSVRSVLFRKIIAVYYANGINVKKTLNTKCRIFNVKSGGI